MCFLLIFVTRPPPEGYENIELQNIAAREICVHNLFWRAFHLSAVLKIKDDLVHCRAAGIEFEFCF